MDDAPALSIGGEGSVPLFRVTDALRLPSGRIVVADGAPRILVFDAEGRRVGRLGRGGEGPGEFRAIEWLQRVPGDSVVAWDPQGRRLSWFSSDGGAGRALTPDAAPDSRGVPRLVGAFPDGTLLASQLVPPEDVPRARSFILRPDLRLMLYDAEGRFEADLTEVPGDELAYLEGVRMQSAPLPKTHLALGRGRIYVAPGARFAASVFDRNGTLVGSVSRPFEPVPLEEADLEELGLTDGPEVPQPPSFPAISSILLDATGHLWMRPFTREDRLAGEVEWSVFGPDGTFRGVVSLPRRFEPTDIGEDYLLGVFRDSLDVEQVQLHALSRAER